MVRATHWRWLFVFAALVLLHGGPAIAQRHALVIGNGAYQAVPALPNPPSDAQALSRALQGLGFKVELLVDADRASMLGAVARLAANSIGSEAALLFYAGHAVEIGGRNMLLPVSVPNSAAGLERDAIPFDEIERSLQGRALTTLVVLDSCRNNPFVGQSLPAAARRASGRAQPNSESGAVRSIGNGMAGVASASGMLIAFATSPGRVALDGTGAHSPFTAALLQHIDAVDVEIRQMLGRVRRAVREATGGQQIPWDNSSLETEFFFRSSVAVRTARPVPAPPPPPRAAPSTAGSPSSLPYVGERRPLDFTPYVERRVDPHEWLRMTAGTTQEYVRRPFGLTRTFSPGDGTIYVSWDGQGGGRDRGEVFVDGDRVCSRYPRFRGGQVGCAVVVREGYNFTFVPDVGLRTDITFRQGDAYGLAR